jgi:hypothetical protein
MIDGGADLDLEAVLQNIAEAEIVCLYFPNLDRTLVVDTRTSESAGQMVKVVPMARDSADRLRTIRMMRPQLPRPTSITMIPWVRRVDSLEPLGVWAALEARLVEQRRARRCLETLRALERAEVRGAILGHDYRALWVRSGARG